MWGIMFNWLVQSRTLSRRWDIWPPHETETWAGEGGHSAAPCRSDCWVQADGPEAGEGQSWWHLARVEDGAGLEGDPVVDHRGETVGADEASLEDGEDTWQSGPLQKSGAFGGAAP